MVGASKSPTYDRTTATATAKASAGKSGDRWHRAGDGAGGQGRGNNSEFRPFVSIALGSLSELRALVLLARDLEYLENRDMTRFWTLTEEVGKMLGTLHAHLTQE